MFEEKYEYVLEKIQKEYGSIGEWIAQVVRLEKMIGLFQNMPEEDFERFREITAEEMNKNVQFSKKCLVCFQQNELEALWQKLQLFPYREYFYQGSEKRFELMNGLSALIKEGGRNQELFNAVQKLFEDHFQTVEEQQKKCRKDQENRETYIQSLEQDRIELWSKEKMAKYHIDEETREKLIFAEQMTEELIQLRQQVEEYLLKLSGGKEERNNFFVRIPTTLFGLESILEKLAIQTAASECEQVCGELLSSLDMAKQSGKDLNEQNRLFVIAAQHKISELKEMQKEVSLTPLERYQKYFLSDRNTTSNRQRPFLKKQIREELRQKMEDWISDEQYQHLVSFTPQISTNCSQKIKEEAENLKLHMTPVQEIMKGIKNQWGGVSYCGFAEQKKWFCQLPVDELTEYLEGIRVLDIVEACLKEYPLYFRQNMDKLHLLPSSNDLLDSKYHHLQALRRQDKFLIRNAIEAAISNRNQYTFVDFLLLPEQNRSIWEQKIGRQCLFPKDYKPRWRQKIDYQVKEVDRDFEDMTKTANTLYPQILEGKGDGTFAMYWDITQRIDRARRVQESEVLEKVIPTYSAKAPYQKKRY